MRGHNRERLSDIFLGILQGDHMRRACEWFTFAAKVNHEGGINVTHACIPSRIPYVTHTYIPYATHTWFICIPHVTRFIRINAFLIHYVTHTWFIRIHAHSIHTNTCIPYYLCHSHVISHSLTPLPPCQARAQAPSQRGWAVRKCAPLLSHTLTRPCFHIHAPLLSHTHTHTHTHTSRFFFARHALERPRGWAFLGSWLSATCTQPWLLPYNLSRC